MTAIAAFITSAAERASQPSADQSAAPTHRSKRRGATSPSTWLFAIGRRSRRAANGGHTFPPPLTAISQAQLTPSAGEGGRSAGAERSSRSLLNNGFGEGGRRRRQSVSQAPGIGRGDVERAPAHTIRVDQHRELLENFIRRSIVVLRGGREAGVIDVIQTNSMNQSRKFQSQMRQGGNGLYFNTVDTLRSPISLGRTLPGLDNGLQLMNEDF
ncbi:hypothetical protein chiPu_0002575 [Chiloscyllium punctatum]|uniref:Uncharacterized protein n=1 Tax=Chiloscyllium punctatum TaxID=137246 RepID=A0A401S1B0_CHIPU|nr:hypothetical protein [Chiloscyllium punctatum]